MFSIYFISCFFFLLCGIFGLLCFNVVKVLFSWVWFAPKLLLCSIAHHDWRVYRIVGLSFVPLTITQIDLKTSLASIECVAAWPPKRLDTNNAEVLGVLLSLGIDV